MKPMRETISSLLNQKIEIPFRRWLPSRQGAGWFAYPFFSRDSLGVQQHALLLTLAMAHENQLNPRMIIEFAIAENRGAYRHKLAFCAKRMRQGTMWLDAIEQTPGVLSDEHVVALRSGLQSGSLSETYLRTIESDQRWLETSRELNDGQGVYYFVVIALMLIVSLFIGVFIAPTMVSIQREFGMERSIFLTCVSGVTKHFFLAFQVVPWYVTTLAILLAYFVLLRLMRWFAPYLRRGSSWTTSAKAKGNVLRILATTCDSGRPLHGSLSTLAKYHLDRSLRGRLLLARNELEQGAEPWETLVQAKLLQKPESKVLQHAKSRTSQAWILDQLADLREQSHFQWLYWRSRVIHWCVTIVLGAIVLFMCLSIFEFLPRLIQSLAAT